MTDLLALVTVDSVGYKLLLLVHIIAIIGAFGPLMASGPINRLAVSKTGNEAKALAELPLSIATKVSMPPFIVALISGMAMVVTSDDVFAFSQQWISLAFALVLAIALVYFFLLIPAQKRLVAAVQAGDEKNVRSGVATSAAATGVIHLCMLLLIIDMVWKPGL